MDIDLIKSILDYFEFYIYVESLCMMFISSIWSAPLEYEKIYSYKMEITQNIVGNDTIFIITFYLFGTERHELKLTWTGNYSAIKKSHSTITYPFQLLLTITHSTKHTCIIIDGSLYMRWLFDSIISLEILRVAIEIEVEKFHEFLIQLMSKT